LKKLLLIYLIFLAFNSFAQQGLYMDFTEQDSAQMKLQRQIEYYQLISGNNFNTGLLTEKIELQDVDLMSEFNNQQTISFNFSPLNPYQYMGISAGMASPAFFPFYRNGSILSADAFQLGDKFVLGGYSYGTNSIFSAPHPNQGMNNNFDSYGSTLFMQYKVSKKFKIETRINVQQSGRHPGF